MDISRIRSLKNRLEVQIRSADPAILERFPVETYLDLVSSIPKNVSYEYLSPEVKGFCDRVLLNSTEHVMVLYNKWLLVSLIMRAVDGSLYGMRVPDKVKGFFSLNFERILNDVEESTTDAGLYLFPHDKFLKDLGVCSLNLIPVGVQKLDQRPLPLSFLFRKGPAQFIRRLAFLLLEVRGVAPFYDQHTDSHDPHLMSRFHPEGWRQNYMTYAEVLKMQPEVKGVFGRTWFIDPQLEKISPRLCYVRHLNLQNGARLFHLGPSNENGIGDALYKSARRRELYEKGEYIPQDYLQIWLRKPMIQWFEQQKDLDEKGIREFQDRYSRGG